MAPIFYFVHLKCKKNIEELFCYFNDKYTVFLLDFIISSKNNQNIDLKNIYWKLYRLILN